MNNPDGSGEALPLATAFVALYEKYNQEKSERAVIMPTNQAAITALFSVWQRLLELGWRDARFCPKDGTVFEVLEFGSTGIHDCHYEGEWPDGSYWIHANNDLSPSRPVMFRLKP